MVELIAGAVVFTIAVTGFFGIQVSKRANILAVQQLLMAQEGCANKLEELRATGRKGLGKLDGSRFDIGGLKTGGGLPGRVSVSERRGLWEVSVEAKWDSRGRERSFKLWTLLPKDK